MVLGVLQSLGYSNTALKDAREDWSIRGLGTSDDIKIAKQLVNKFDYVNTYYHKGPKLDLTSVDPQWRECAQFVICSDVLEHVPPPTHSALEGLFSVVASGGAAIISIPYTTADTTVEFYLNLSGMKFEIIKLFGMTQMVFNTLTTIQSFMVEQDKPLRLEFGH